MSYAPQTILDVRKLFQKHVPSLSNVELGIVGDDSHANSGSSYHLGKDALRKSAYSIIEAHRDRNGLSNAASALDIGYFSIATPSGTQTLSTFNKWLVRECERGAPDTKDIREIIYSVDRKTVKRWDRLNVRDTGDNSHLTHTHISWFRDSEERNKTGIFERWFRHIGQKVEIKMVKVEGNVPLLKRGMDDPIDNTNWTHIKRAQRLLQVTDDGDYGPATSKAVREYAAEKLNRKVSGDFIDAQIWTHLFGLR